MSAGPVPPVAMPRGPRPESVRRTPFEEARRLALELCTPLASERVALDDAAGRILAEDVVASADIVPFARSAMDGFAVRAADVRAGVFLPLVAEPIFAQRGDRTHAPSTATPIATGAPLPHGADAVVPIEAVRVDDGRVAFSEGVRPGDHVFAAGDDARAGETIATAGRPLAAATLALLAANGSATLVVTRRPRVAIVTTGTEIVAVEASPAHGQIRNSNRSLLLASLQAAGAEVVLAAHVPDDERELERVLAVALSGSDLVVTTGGASVGTRDLVKATLERLGVAFAFTSVALRPAKPTAFGCRGAVAVATLPGNPAAAHVALQEFVIPAVGALGGRSSPLPPRVRARLAGTIRSKAERTFAAFAALRVADDGTLEAVPLEDQCSSLTRIASDAAALIVVPPGERTYVAGDLVDADVVDWSRVAAGGDSAEGVAPGHVQAYQTTRIVSTASSAERKR